MKKKFLLVAMAFLAITAFAQNQETNSYVPNGYQGFLEECNSWHFDKNMLTTVQLSTTHGFYFNDCVYAGIGLGLEFNSDYFLLPFYTNLRYIFVKSKPVSPFVSLRLGSYASENMGAYGDLAFGVRFSSKKDFAVSVLITGTYYDNLYYTRYEEYVDAQGIWHNDMIKGKVNPSGISLRVGIEW